MSTRRTPVLVMEDGRRMGTITHVAEMLGTSTSQVHTWTTRRVTNGCPEPDPDIHRGTFGHAAVDWYDLDDWRVWHLFYDPQRGVPVRARSTDPARGGPTAVARALGVSDSRVTTWISRRDRNGCPKPGEDGLYSFAEWKNWLPGYLAALATQEHLRAKPVDGDRGSPAVVGRVLGEDVKRVSRWITDRARTGCPEPGEDGLYSIPAWQAWYADWQQRPSVQAARQRRPKAA